MSRTTLLFRQTIFPLVLIFGSPIFVFLFCFTNVKLGGSLMELAGLVSDAGFFATLSMAWKPYFFGSKTAWIMLGGFVAAQMLFLRFLPGKIAFGPVSPAGNVPSYKANGPLAFFLTIFLFLFSSFYLGLFSPTIIYDHFFELLGALNLFSLAFCLLLLVKGYYMPSSKDAGGTGNLIFDYYWGTELYPKLFGSDIKQLVNCRLGMMFWPIFIVSFAAKEAALHGLSDSMAVSVALQLIYIAKFFFWETGYLRSLDVMHDRSGFYICWGLLVWVPGIYTSQALYLVNHPVHLGWALSCIIFFFGVAAILINYLADRQRQVVRATNGECLVWGQKPKLIKGQYETELGERKENYLLASGWWGISRHFHYVPELIASFAWSVPALFTHFLPYFYVVYLFILLVERAFRDDRRCREKYGKSWDAYCEKVPYKIIPPII